MHDLDGAIPDAVTHVGHYMIDKQKHFKTLMLAMYYAVHGEMWFDMMFAPEKGSSGYRENIVAAAHALELSYYQVHLIPRSMRVVAKILYKVVKLLCILILTSIIENIKRL